jgi:hypothetical protein
VGDATLQLGLLSAYASEKEAQTAAAVASFKALGAEILAAKYDNGTLLLFVFVLRLVI